jgi:hypothetical protein
VTGKIELALIEMSAQKDRPGYVTQALTAALESIGRIPADDQVVSDLCVADRQYLMLRLDAILNGELMWLKVGCRQCESPFDVEVKRCDLPVKPAGKQYPFVTLSIRDREIRLKVPTGKDQAAIETNNKEEAMAQLLKRCITSVNGGLPEQDCLDSFTADDIERIDTALDEASPAVCSQLLVTCPECGQEQQAHLDHYSLGHMNPAFFYDEIHTLASHYHWSESDILDLPRNRRRLYLNLISRSDGMTTQGAGQ